MDIKSVIKEKGFTLSRVVEELKDRGLMPRASKSSLSQSINGNPNISTLRSIAEVIGCDIVDFFTDEVEHNVISCPHRGKKIAIEIKKVE